VKRIVGKIEQIVTTDKRGKNVQTGFSLLVRDLERKYGDFGLFLTGQT
jgi:hypothetical protein